MEDARQMARRLCPSGRYSGRLRAPVRDINVKRKTLTPALNGPRLVLFFFLEEYIFFIASRLLPF